MEKIVMAEVSFTTDLDSISFQMKIGDQQDFIVLLNGKDSAFTSFRSVPPKVVFSDDYVKGTQREMVRRSD